jgi:hypothetical protein
VGIVHKGHMDLQTQEERHDLESVDDTHTYQYEESESPLLEIPLIDQVGETNRMVGHLLTRQVLIDEDDLLVGRGDHVTCLDMLYGIWEQMIVSE